MIVFLIATACRADLPLASVAAAWAVEDSEKPNQPALLHQDVPLNVSHNVSLDKTERNEAEQQQASSLIGKATAALAAPLLTIVEKKHLAASEDARDYHSLSIYWWPVQQADGSVVYEHRDGERNPEANEFDAGKLRLTCDRAFHLAQAFAVTHDQKFADRCTEVIQVFFLDEQTGMRPHLKYAQAIPGHSSGNRQGIIEGLPISLKLLDAATLLNDSRSWRETEPRLWKWIRSFRNWLLESEFGRQEAGRANNHATWYDVQIVSLSVWLGERSFAEEWIRDRSMPRLLKQIVPNGGQPFESYRSKSFEYSVYNLQGWLAIARISRVLQIEWPVEQIERLDAAIQFLSDLDGGRKWPFRQIRPVNYQQLYARLFSEWQALRSALKAAPVGVEVQ